MFEKHHIRSKQRYYHSQVKQMYEVMNRHESLDAGAMLTLTSLVAPPPIVHLSLGGEHAHR